MRRLLTARGQALKRAAEAEAVSHHVAL